MRKLLSLLLVLCMLMSLAPMSTFASETDKTMEETVNEVSDPSSDDTDKENSTETSEGSDEDSTETSEGSDEDSTETSEGSDEDSTETSEGSDGDPTKTSEGSDGDSTGTSEEPSADFEDVEETELLVSALSEYDTAVDEGRGIAYVSPRDTSGDPVYKILHIDAGRKYTSLATLKTMVDYVAFNGMNQIDLYLSDNQGLRFGVTDSNGQFIISANGTTYDLTEALGYYDNTAEPSKSTDKIDKWLTPAEMKELIVYAANKGVDIVPSINMPGHMAAILQGSGDARISAFGKTFGDYTSNESMDMGNVEAVNFALALLDTYCSYFYGITDAQGNRLVKYFSIAADEYGQDLLYHPCGSGFGTAYMNANGEYHYLVDFLNRAGNVIKSYGMTPRAFNDAFLSDGNTDADALGLNTDYQLYYWGSGWGGMINASPEVLNSAGFDVINCNSNYYYICCQTRPYKTYIDTPEAIQSNPIELKKFTNGTVSFNPAGAMFCIWCDHCSGGTAHETNVSGEGMQVMSAWAACLADTADETYEYVEKTDSGTGIKVGATGLSDISVVRLESNPQIAAAATGKIQTYSVQMRNSQTDYAGSYRIYLPIPAGWDAGKVCGFTVGQIMTLSVDDEAPLPVADAGGSVKDGYYVLDMDTPYATVGLYELAAATDGQEVVNITLSVGDTYDFGTLTGDYRSKAGDYTAFTIAQTGFTAAVPGEAATPPSALDMTKLVSGETYLLSDGNGNYLSLTSAKITNSTDPDTATKWKVTANSGGTYSFSTTYEQWGSTTTGYLALQTYNPYILVIGNSATNFSYDAASGFNVHHKNYERDNDYYLEYTSGGSWALTQDSITGAAAKVYTLGTEGTPDTPATTTLLLTATKAGTASVTIGNTVYNVTVNASVTSARCEEHDITVSGHGVNGLTCAVDSSVTSINGYESVTGVKIAAYSLTPDVDGAVYRGEVIVRMPVPAEWTAEGGIIQAFLKQDTGTVVVPVTIADGYATYTVPGGTVSGLFKLPAGYFTKEVNILMGNDSETTRIQQGAYTTSDVYYCDDSGLVTVTSEVTSAYIPAVPEGITTRLEAGDSFYITDGNGNYMALTSEGAITNTTNMDEAIKWKVSEIQDGRLNIWGGSYQLCCATWGIDNLYVATGGQGWNACMYLDPDNGLYQVNGSNTRYVVFDGTNWTMSSSTDGHSQIYGFGSDAVPAKSTVTITSGADMGTTSVVVGTTKYNITVADKSLVDTKITVYAMITNNLVKIGENEQGAVCHVDINAAMLGITSEDGIDITTLFPTYGERKDDTTVFWKMTWLPAGSHQGTESGSPYLDVYEGVAGSTSGMTGYEHRVDFTRLRYYNNRWEFYLDPDEDAWYEGEEWGTDTDGDGVKESSGWYPVSPTEEDIAAMPGAVAGEGQVVAYYLQVTDVTREVITNVADWGPAIDDTRNIGYGSSYVLLDFAVRYEDGVRNPNEIGTFPYATGGYSASGEQYNTDKTMGFHCTDGWGGVVKDDNGVYWRTVNTILATTDTIDGYEIYMITTTKSDENTPLSTVDCSKNKRLSNGDGTYTGGYDYDTATETIVWLKDEDVQYDADTYLIDTDTVAYGYRENGTHTNGVPLVSSVTIQNQHAVLVTYYVRYVGQTADDLNVHYINRTLNDLEFYTYGIHVKAGTVFDPDFARVEGTEYDLTGDTVENYYDVIQTVQGDPRNILDVGSFYRSTKLTLVEVRRSEDGKDVYLYYTTDNAKDMVIDFGLPVEITKDSMQLELASDEVVQYIASIDGTTLETDDGSYFVQSDEYGYFYTDLANNKCYYVPTTVMRGTESMRMAVVTNQSTAANPNRYVLSIHPATTMYYEQYFAAFEGSWEGTIQQPTMGASYISGFIGSQQSAYPGMDGANNYGYDGVYRSAKKTQASTATQGSKATFEFTGNGFEVYADCTTSTGTVMVALYSVSGETETMKSIYMVNTVRQSGNGDLTQYEGDSNNTPIVSVRDLDYGNYKVAMFLTGYSEPYFVFDGFRVFNTMGSSIDEKVYDEDAESQPGFYEIRDSVLVAKLPDKDSISEDSVYVDQIAEDVSSQVYALKGDQPVRAVLMTGSDEALEETTVTDYLDNGTKNEVYIRPNQSLVITMPSEAIAAKTQIGMKTLTGSVTLGSTTVSETNMYYHVTNDGDTITIQNSTDAIISVTDLKVPGGIPETSVASPLSLRSGVMQTLLWMGYEEEPEATESEATEPEETESKATEPEVTEPETTEPEDTYNPSAVYRGGDTVVYNGKTYRAKWWTRGENPEKAWWVWELIDDGNETDSPAVEPWSATKVYTAGMQVSYKGHIYEAKWWVLGRVPSDSKWGGWKLIS